MVHNIPFFVAIFFCVLWGVLLFAIFKSDFFINLSVRYFLWLIKIHGLEGEIRPTPKAKIIFKAWNYVMLFILSCFITSFFWGRFK